MTLALRREEGSRQQSSSPPSSDPSQNIPPMIVKEEMHWISTSPTDYPLTHTRAPEEEEGCRRWAARGTAAASKPGGPGEQPAAGPGAHAPHAEHRTSTPQTNPQQQMWSVFGTRCAWKCSRAASWARLPAPLPAPRSALGWSERNTASRLNPGAKASEKPSLTMPRLIRSRQLHSFPSHLQIHQSSLKRRWICWQLYYILTRSVHSIEHCNKTKPKQSKKKNHQNPAV